MATNFDQIILYLVPSEPTSSDKFTASLQNLTINAYDLSFGNSVKGSLIGTAQGLAKIITTPLIPGTPTTAPVYNNKVDITKTAIIQGSLDTVTPIGPAKIYKRVLTSVAVAVIKVDPAAIAGKPEYPGKNSYDLRLEITRGSLKIVDHTLEYNVKVTNKPLSKDQCDYFDQNQFPASAYVTLPPADVGQDPNLATIDIPANGVPPNFDDLVKAINMVLAKDPSGVELKTLLDPLTEMQSLQIANEVIWNRTQYPMPAPEPPRSLDQMYTKPPADPATSPDDQSKAEQDRKKFEGELESYHATHDAEAGRLSVFVYAASQAVACEKLTVSASKAGLTFPLLPATTAKAIPEGTVILADTNNPPQPLQPAFIVPAAYFYALGAKLPPKNTADKRYSWALYSAESDLLTEFQTAADAGAIGNQTVGSSGQYEPFAAPVTIAGPAINGNQAARRLRALGATTGPAPQVPVTAEVAPLVQDWLDYTDTSEQIDSLFWPAEVSGAGHPDAYLQLVLEGITNHYQPLIDAIRANIQTVPDLFQVQDVKWQAFFLDTPLPPGTPAAPAFPAPAGTPAPRISLLPPFTQAGGRTPANRVEAFITHLKNFFVMPVVKLAAGSVTLGTPPAFDRPNADVFAAFALAYHTHAGADYVFGGGANDAGAVQQAVGDVFPNDQPAQAWLQEAIQTIEALLAITSIGQDELQFSLVEALYARGFTDAASVKALSQDDFQAALSGTVAYDQAPAIYAKAGGAGPVGGPAQTAFSPVNPDGTLSNIIPPAYLSPLGPVNYLHELLQLFALSTCESPFQREPEGTIGVILANRRGALGDLSVTRPNLETPLPLIDLVNESLEALAAGSPGGAVYDTAGDALAGHRLRGHPGTGEHPEKGAPYAHDPQTLFAAIPEHSSPATPVEKPAAYDALKADFTAPALPYDQPVDINRSYLEQLGTNRFATMRHFRKEITEFAIDAAHQPADFQSHLWRLPARLDAAREYLRITKEEYDLLYSQDLVDVPAENRLLLREVYGFPADTVNDIPWTEIAGEVSEFTRRTGLTYCQFLELWQAKFVDFQRAGGEIAAFPACQPACPSNLRIQFVKPQEPKTALRELAVFVRLWRRLQELPGTRFTFAQLTDICSVLGLFDAGGAINPDFIRQLAALKMLCDWLRLPLAKKGPVPAGATGIQRTQLLALWTGPGTPEWDWALARLLDAVEDLGEARPKKGRRGPELLKLNLRNLDSLSLLAGFDPGTATDTWFAHPTSTLRFAEVLYKINVSDFTVGEILFLFTADPHLEGDDPFRLPDPNESTDDPFELPDEEEKYGLWALRRKLLEVDVDEEEAEKWTWPIIEHALRSELGYAVNPGDTDLFDVLGEHFFPSVLERHGHPVSVAARQFRADLPPANTSAPVWNNPPGGPFHYDAAAKQLWAQLPIHDETVFEKLSEARAVNDFEQAAVSDVYYAARAALAPFALIFGNFDEAADRLIQEPEERERYRFFQWEFARFIRRCQVISEHLDKHVAAAVSQEAPDGHKEAWRVLRDLSADENMSLGDWEEDSGAVPPLCWGSQPNGGAFAALLGLTGTGLLGRVSAPPGQPVWEEVRGPLSAFGHERNEWNAPVPGVLPAMSLTLTPAQLKLATVHNGFAFLNDDGQKLGGGQPFAVQWSGVLLVERAGSYRFHAGAPTPEEQEPDFEAAEAHRWRVILRRGQKTWVLLNYHWGGEDAPASHSAAVGLRPGAYEITIDYAQPDPAFARNGGVVPVRSGFQLKYSGPDSDGRLATLPLDRLFRDKKDESLGEILGKSGAAGRYLNLRYTSTLRDIRRTYQRAFKAILFARRFHLSAKPVHNEQQSELGYILDHGDAFLGSAYHRTGPAEFATHHAYLNFNLLPVSDPYLSPQPTQDHRVQPSAWRKAALFDWWERIFDYCQMRREAEAALERPAWLVFQEAGSQDPAVELSTHLGIDIRHAPLVLNYFAVPIYTVTGADLGDERWVVRVWQAEKWVRAVLKHFAPQSIGDALPDLWASDDPDQSGAAAAPSGNENLTQFYQNGCFENGDPRRYEDLKKLNDRLRERARAALLAYLRGMDRVPLPWAKGTFARSPRDLSDLLLQDVEVGICEKGSRVEDAISSVQTFTTRARLGLEPGFPVPPAFALLIDQRFGTFRDWEGCKKRDIYRENWIEWDELETARRSEAFRFLEDELRSSTLTEPKPGGAIWWSDRPIALNSPLTVLQDGQPSELELADGSAEGLSLMGTPERAARLSWLAPVLPASSIQGNGVQEDGGNPPPDHPAPAPGPHAVAVPPQPGPTGNLPLWIQAAVRLGTRFIRVAAAGIPPASTAFAPILVDPETGCCKVCGKVHPPVVDEYYFWLQDAHYYNGITQNADVGADLLDSPDSDPTSDWHRPEQLPGLLNWEPDPMVMLFWCRVHNGEFQQLRRSDDGLLVDPKSTPELVFAGRTADSLRFTVTSGEAPAGYPVKPEPGFRYDMPGDSAVVLPQVALADPASGFPGGLTVYPYFTFFEPGARLEPPSLFSVAVTVASALRTYCRFEPALKWYNLAFNPLQSDNTWAQCGVQDGAGGDPAGAVAVPADDAPCCPSEPVSDTVARDRAVTLQYLETLLSWGDALMCRRNSPESVRQAAVIFDVIERVLGEHPATVFASDNGPAGMTVAKFIEKSAPLNPRLLSLYDRTADRLGLVHRCQSAQRLREGRPHRDMPYLGDDPALDGWQMAEAYCQEDECVTCCSPYRFTFRIQKAIEMAGQVRALGSELLAAYEKGDAEFLSSLRAAHERQLYQLTLDARRNQWREADWQVQALQKSKTAAQSKKSYYDGLIAGKLNAGENGYLALTGVSTESRLAGNISEAVGQGMTYTPDISLGGAGLMGTPLEVNQLPIGNKLATNFSTYGRIMNWLGEIASTGAAVSITEGGWDRREQDWREQSEALGYEIQQIERQILGSERHCDAALRELNNLQRQLEYSIEVQDFLRDKFTNHALYLFLQKETAALYFQAYQLALDIAQQARQSFQFELGNTTDTYLPEAGWDSLHEGLLAGERLELALRQMEKAYLDSRCREYELTKSISLRLSFPLAFLQLLITGRCEVEIPEWLFDLDYPGQYFRRIKNVSLTIPCVVGPYTGVHCRLTLLSSSTRIDPRLIDPPEGCCPEDDRKSGYLPLPQDPRIVRRYGATEAIATSSGQNDAGLFELNFRDERYLPFEFEGAISRWRIELPHENNLFDVINTMSDVILTMNFTSREGGAELREAANELAQRRLREQGIRLIDIERDMPETWQVLHTRAEEKKSPRQFTLRLKRDMFPFIPGGRKLVIQQLGMLFDAHDEEPGANMMVEFLENHHDEHENFAEERAEGEVTDVLCIASSEWPDLYHGTLQLSKPRAIDRGYADLGIFRFPAKSGNISRAYLLVNYHVADHDDK